MHCNIFYCIVCVFDKVDKIQKYFCPLLTFKFTGTFYLSNLHVLYVYVFAYVLLYLQILGAFADSIGLLA